MYGDTPGLTAHLAVFHVVLILAAAGVEAHAVLFAAVGTDDGTAGVRRPIAEREVAVEVEVIGVVEGEVHEGKILAGTRSLAALRMTARGWRVQTRRGHRLRPAGSRCVPASLRRVLVLRH